MANEARKHRRAAARQTDGSSNDDKPSLAPPALQDPLGPAQLKSLLLRLGLPVAAVWVIGILFAGFSTSRTVQIVALSLPVAVTALAVGLVVFALRQANKARGVQSILSGVNTAEERQAALSKLESTFKKNDPAAIFARAQLELQEDPKKALATLEQIDLAKVMAPVADEARSQRALIHLMLGEVSAARQLVDNIDLKRHQEPRTRAMLAAVVGEAWARSGQAKKALEILELYDPDDELYAQLKPQIYRAYAFAYAHTSDTKGMRRCLKKLLEQDARLLGGFLMKKTHPLLQKEAKKLLEQSGQIPRKMMVQRR